MRSSPAHWCGAPPLSQLDRGSPWLTLRVTPPSPRRKGAMPWRKRRPSHKATHLQTGWHPGGPERLSARNLRRPSGHPSVETGGKRPTLCGLMPQPYPGGSYKVWTPPPQRRLVPGRGSLEIRSSWTPRVVGRCWSASYTWKPSNRTGTPSRGTVLGWWSTLWSPSLRTPTTRLEVGIHPPLPHMRSGGVVLRALQPSLPVHKVLGRVGPLPFPPPPILATHLKRHGRRHRKPPRSPALYLGVVPWGTRLPLVLPTNIFPCLAVGGRADSPSNLFPSEMGVVGVDAWVGIGLGGGGVWGVWPHGWSPIPLPCTGPLQTGPPPPPLGAWRNGGGGMCGCPLQPKFFYPPPLWGMV